MSERIVITQEKKDKLKAEVEILKERKKDLSSSLEQARQSDVSEDTDAVVAVMGELEKVDERISEIKEVLANSQVMKNPVCDVDHIGVGCSVKVEIGGKKKLIKIVSEVESEPSENKISDKSPLGKAISKAKVGDTVKVKVADRVIEYKLLGVN